MATKEQIELIVEELTKSIPCNLLNLINDFNAGIGFALKLLYSAEGNHLSAGAISEAMKVSTARVAVLLKKMESKGFIVKENDKTDARITIVQLSDKGKKVTEEMRERMFEHISGVVDKLSIEKLQQFINLSIEVKTAMEENFPTKPED